MLMLDNILTFLCKLELQCILNFSQNLHILPVISLGDRFWNLHKFIAEFTSNQITLLKY